jgi:hypothetical protein
MYRFLNWLAYQIPLKELEMMKRFIMFTVLLATIIMLSTAGLAGTFTWTVDGPTEIQPGKSITLTITVTASGTTEYGVETFNMYTQYTLSANGASYPANPSYLSFNAVDGVLSGTATLNVTVIADAGIVPNASPFVLALYPGVRNTMYADPHHKYWQLTVKQLSRAPEVTINNAEQDYLYGSLIPISATINDNGTPVSAVTCVVGGANVPLTYDAQNQLYTGNLKNLSPGIYDARVTATNAGGTAYADDVFKVYVKFGQWLPPIATSNKQMKMGSTLPLKFTVAGAMGPVDNTIARPEIFIDDQSYGIAGTYTDSTGLVYFQQNITLPSTGSHFITVKEPNMELKTINITVK